MNLEYYFQINGGNKNIVTFYFFSNKIAKIDLKFKFCIHAGNRKELWEIQFIFQVSLMITETDIFKTYSKKLCIVYFYDIHGQYHQKLDDYYGWKVDASNRNRTVCSGKNWSKFYLMKLFHYNHWTRRGTGKELIAKRKIEKHRNYYRERKVVFFFRQQI